MLLYFGSLLHINCQQSYWFLHDLVECPGWELVERFFDSEDFCVPLHSVVVITMISPRKFVSYLYLKRPAEQRSLSARTLGVTLPAAGELNSCLSVSCWALLLAPERCQSLSCRVLLLWNMWTPLLLTLAFVKLQRWWKYWWGRVRECAQQNLYWKNCLDCEVAFWGSWWAAYPYSAIA